ncbi:hypothetical protein PDL71_10500 [Lacibacter sp. MH-610]
MRKQTNHTGAFRQILILFVIISWGRISLFYNYRYIRKILSGKYVWHG